MNGPRMAACLPSDPFEPRATQGLPTTRPKDKIRGYSLSVVKELSFLTSVTLTMSCASGTAFEGRKAAKIIGVEMSSENLRHYK